MVRIAFMNAFETYYEEFRRMFINIDVKLFFKNPIKLDELAAKSVLCCTARTVAPTAGRTSILA